MVENESVLKSSESISCQNDQQLEAKTDKCTLVKSDLQELQHSNTDAVKTMQESQEKFCKVSLQDKKLLYN